MTSGSEQLTRKQKREAARTERKRKEAEALARKRRSARLKRLAAVTAAAAAIVAAGVLSQGGSGSSVRGSGANVQGVAAVTALLAGIPQKDKTLGSPNAPATITEYGDLQCPVCGRFAKDTLPAVISKLVHTGTAKLVFHNWTIIDQTDSVTAAQASYAAAEQGRYWQFVDLFYANQGAERTGYVTAAFLDGIAKAAGMNVAQFDVARQNPAFPGAIQHDGAHAVALGFRGTPAFLVSGRKGSQPLPEGMPTGITPFLDAIHAVS